MCGKEKEGRVRGTGMEGGVEQGRAGGNGYKEERGGESRKAGREDEVV